MNSYKGLKKILLILVTLCVLVCVKDFVSADEGDFSILVWSANRYEYVEPTGIDGLSWDAAHNTLTMNNYDGYGIRFSSLNKCEKVKIIVKGKNRIIDSDNKSTIGLRNVDITFEGDGFLEIKHEREKFHNIGYYSSDNQIPSEYNEDIHNGVIVDGPTISLISSSRYGAIYVDTFEMKSGCVMGYHEPYKEIREDYDGTIDFEYYNSTIAVTKKVNVTGGTILARYEEKDCVTGRSRTIDLPIFALVINGDYYPEISLSDCLIIGQSPVYSYAREPEGYIYTEVGYVTKNFDENLWEEVSYKKYQNVNHMGAGILGRVPETDISNFKVSLDSEKYVYDGKEKKPKVKVCGLRPGIDYIFFYNNNTNVGTAEVVITGIGYYKGTVVVKYQIEIDKKETNKEDTDKKDTKISKACVIKDKGYKYNVIKKATKKKAGTVEVIGFRKKSLKSVKIASIVKINGYKYKVISIGENAFYGNKKIKKVSIGKNVKEIKEGAFANCKKLKRIVIKTKKLKKIGKKAYSGVKKNCVIVVPKNMKKYYKKLIKEKNVRFEQ
ncbi:Leucine rich repeat-containing protein [Eubacterium uniforme]|uniref:Leucine rich repeat-containing protein n=1 Tax=Eubacterium uniforme TaxID=39495 RepID=A0A1T4VDS4_9FIRM|nr:leucine-rich repeat protein [Eubacterium uniforme]SKA63046.1 Leucine rich repeat-containing protein [Eubacterium uniforme]